MAKGRVWVLLILLFGLLACSKHKSKIYISDCSANIKFKKVSFRNLIDSIEYYDAKYVEVSGRYLEGKHVSALVNDSTFANHEHNKSLWVNFTQDCPLYLKGKNIGLFETEDGAFNQLNNKSMNIKGRIDIEKKGNKKTYSATINQVSYLELN